MSPLQLAAAVLTDVGCRRATNEDAACVLTPDADSPRGSFDLLAVVADGMGGHSAGELASRLAVDTIRHAFADDRSGTTAIDAALLQANDAIYQRASEHRELRGMGTTCVALVISGDTAVAAHVGDSRLYLARGGAIFQMTADHSAVAEMVNQGLISKEDARRHEDRNVLLRALGTQPSVAVSTWPEPLPLRDGDAFLLCSDGLTDLVADDELLEAMDGRSEADACRALVTLARARGGFDNITACVVRMTRELEVQS